MKREIGLNWLRRTTAGIVLVAYSAACTHLPSGQKAFDDFDSCFGANLALAAAGGVGVGVLTSRLTGGGGTGKAVGAAAGIATAAMIAMTAWKKCAAAYNKSEAVKPQQAAAPQAVAATRKRSLNLDRLEVRMEGTENDPPAPEFDISFFAEDPAAKDVKATFRHKVEIVRFKADANDKLVLANSNDEPLLDGSGKPIPLEAAVKTPRERLHWVTIAEEGKDDYVEDVVIQQGQRMGYRHKLQIPPRAQLPLPLPVPMRYTLSVEADGMSSKRTVDFALLGSGDRPKRYTGTAAVNSVSGNAGSPPAATRSLAAKEATHATRRKVALAADPNAPKKTVASLQGGERVRVEDRASVMTSGKPVEWVKVIPTSRTGGWLRASELVEIK